MNCCNIFQIYASQVNFWDNKKNELELVNELKLMHGIKMYPPRFTLEVHGQNATHDAVAVVEFKGAHQDLSTEIYLSLPTTGTKKPAFFPITLILSRYYNH